MEFSLCHNSQIRTIVVKGNTLSEEGEITLSILSSTPSEKRSTLKGKLLPWEANSFFLE